MRFLVLEKGVDPSGDYSQELINTTFYIRGNAATGVAGFGRLNSDGMVEIKYDSYFNYIQEIVKHPDLEAIVINVGMMGAVFIKMEDIAYISSSSEVHFTDEEYDQYTKAYHQTLNINLNSEPVDTAKDKE